MADPCPFSLVKRLLSVLGEDYVGTPLEVEAQAFLATQSKPTTRPTVMEIVALGDEIEEEGLGQVDLVRRALAGWGCQSHAPIPLTDRHPTPKECDSEGRCWLGTEEETVSIERFGVMCDDGPTYPASWVLEKPVSDPENWAVKRVWLPYRTLPVPRIKP